MCINLCGIQVKISKNPHFHFVKIHLVNIQHPESFLPHCTLQVALSMVQNKKNDRSLMVFMAGIARINYVRVHTSLWHEVSGTEDI